MDLKRMLWNNNMKMKIYKGMNVKLRNTADILGMVLFPTTSKNALTSLDRIHKDVRVKERDWHPWNEICSMALKIYCNLL